ncbi:hypothetical protein BDF20DRAFT_83813 [Mycotypha africana]|uniref:uncharacterized protein n=1 Tax=Mycotypha africana TaxID=64632 RepID=UPI0022FFE8E8|nr:uncharacterized protein BDF20DRAFT_83813 [Mycotypha africana]KAI8992046.1 hypothetical protein BDF20DRAFT_83813 [Mycotypha africana]
MWVHGMCVWVCGVCLCAASLGNRVCACVQVEKKKKKSEICGKIADLMLPNTIPNRLISSTSSNVFFCVWWFIDRNMEYQTRILSVRLKSVLLLFIDRCKKKKKKKKRIRCGDDPCICAVTSRLR